jgi:hypothetical protein
MDTQHSVRIHTLSPVRSPISAHSEQREAAAQQGLTADIDGAGILPASESLKPFPWPWANGYGTLAHDSLPVFFQPLGCYHVEIPDDVHWSENLTRILSLWSGRIDTCQLILYDDTVALLRLDVVIEVSEATLAAIVLSGDLDGTLSDSARDIYQRLIYPEFQRYCRQFPGSRTEPGPRTDQLKNPNRLEVFKDIRFEEATGSDSYVLWTGRYILLPRPALDTPLGEQLCQWASYGGSQSELLESRHHVGSGNILVLSDDPEACRSDWFRGLSLCQFYNAILSIYGGILKSGYSQLTELIGTRRGNSRKLNTLMADITRSLDHLEFTRLEFNDARVGVQAERARIVEDTCTAWKLDNMIGSALERTNLIRSRIARLLEERRTQLNRSVELILSGIGGVALIDLFISLTMASRNLEEDAIPGLLDAFRWLPPDGSIAVSSTILVLVSIYVYLAKR